MALLRHLKSALNQQRRRCRGLLLLLCTAVMLLVLLDHSPQLQQQQLAQDPVVPRSWRARQPAALRRNTSGQVAAPREDLSGENGAATLKRSFVSGTRFVDYDPAEVESKGKAKPPRPPPKTARLSKHAKRASAAESLPPSNDVLRIPDKPALRKSAPLQRTNTRTAPNLKLRPLAGPGGQSSPRAHATDAPGPTSNASSSTNSGTSHDTNDGKSSTINSTSAITASSGHNSASAITASFGQDSARDTEVAPGRTSAADSAALPGLDPAANPASDSAVYQLPGCSCSRRYSATAYGALNGTRSSCGPTADLRGHKQNVISFSFYGNASSAFFDGIAANLRLVPDFYPGWVVRVYHDIDLSVPQQRQLVCDLQCRYDNVDFCDVRDLPGLGDISAKFGMIWRFMPLADDTVERFIVRDLDSLIGSRERAAVDDWIASNRTFHAMRDAPAHGTEILGGMWGGWNRYNDIYRRVRDRIIKVTQWKFKGLDQRVLTVVLWPVILKHRDLIAHDSYLCYYYPMSRPFPTQRQSPFDFVGSPSKEFRLHSHCPYFCRPRQHRDWVWC